MTQEARPRPPVPAPAWHEETLEVYSESPVRSLPGLVWRSVNVGRGEAGLLVERGQVKRTLGPGRHIVGWKLFGVGGTFRRVARVRTEPFSLPFRLYRLGSDTTDLLDAISYGDAVIADPEAFYQSTGHGRVWLTSRQLGSLVASNVQSIADRLASQMGVEALRYDAAIAEDFTRQVASLLGDQLRERGVQLREVRPFLFRRSREADALLEEALALQRDLDRADERNWAAIRQRAHQLGQQVLALEMAAPSEAEVLRTLVSTPSTDAISQLSGVLQNVITRLTGRAVEHAEGLLRQAKVAPKRLGGRVTLAWVSDALSWLFPLTAIASAPVYLLWVRETGLTLRDYWVGVGAFLAFIQIAMRGIELFERWHQRRLAAEDAAPAQWMKRWLTRDASQIDAVLRQQIAQDLESGCVQELQQAIAAAQATGQRKNLEALMRLRQEAHSLVVRIRGAEVAASLFASRDPHTVERGVRLIAFEEETLRLAKAVATLAARASTKSESGEGEPEALGKLSEALDALKRHFAARSVILGGGQAPGVAV